MKKYWINNKYIVISITILLVWAIYESLNLRVSALKYNEMIYFKDLIFFVDQLIFNTSLFYLQPLGPLFIIIPAICGIHSKIHSGFIKNCMTRIEYKKLFSKLYLNSLKCSLIFPVFLIIVYTWCGLITNNFNAVVNKDYFLLFSTICGSNASHIVVFVILYLLNLFLHSIFYVNLGMFFCKKYSNIFISIILSYLSFIFIELIIEIPIRFIFYVLFSAGIVAKDFGLTEVWVYQFSYINIYIYSIFSIMLAITSSMCVYFMYRNKEGVINAIERES